MALSIIPVVLPFRVRGGTDAALPTLAVETVASGPTPAVAIAELMAATITGIDYRSRLEHIFRNQIHVHPPREAVTGPYLYVFGATHLVQTVDLPRRLDGDGARVLEETLTGLGRGGARGVVIDCATIDYLHSAGIGVLAGHLQELPITIFRPQANIAKILDLVGLTTYLAPHPSLSEALQDLTTRILQREPDPTAG